MDFYRKKRDTARKHVLMLANVRKFLDSVARYAAEHGWRLTFVNDGLPPRGWCGDGALLSYSRSVEQMNFAAKLASSGIPCVALSCAHPRLRIPRVLPDYAATARLAARCLKSNNYDNFAFCTEERLRAGKSAYKAFVKELRTMGHPREVPWLVRNELVESRKLDDPGANVEMFRRCFAAMPRPLGIWCFSDSVGSAMLDAALEAGEPVPGEVGILATNDNAIICENQTIPMSSINPDYARIAETACAALDRIMAGGRTGSLPVMIPPRGVSERGTTGIASSGEPLARKAMVWMRDHLGEPVGINELAHAMGVSERKLDRIFRERMQSTPAAQLRMLRLKKSMSMLRSTEFTLERIAGMCGFSHSSHFVNSFRAATGETPDAWRRRWCR